MPSRKIGPLPNFSFVISEFETKEVSWLKLHSNAARSHAAYWGGAKRQRRGQKESVVQQGNTTTFVAHAEINYSSREDSVSDCVHYSAATIRTRRSGKPKSVKSITTHHGSPHQLEPESLQYQPSLPSEIRATDSPFASSLPTFAFCGETFVRQFFMFDHEDHSIMVNGCTLLSYAHHMALTGLGTKTTLLKLKDEVIRRIMTKLDSSSGLLSPWCLTAIMALGAPIVCLVSQNLPNGLSIWEYINASVTEDYLCCADSADTAKRALSEQTIHQQAMYRLFLKSNACYQDAHSVSLLLFISNYINMYAVLKSLTFQL
jgi:hypothetical protein